MVSCEERQDDRITGRVRKAAASGGGLTLEMKKEAGCQLHQKSRHDRPPQNLQNQNPALKDSKAGVPGTADGQQLADPQCKENA